MTFYIELPGDESGNVMLPRAVFEGRIVQGGPDQHPYTNPDRRALIITAPAEIARTHDGMYTDAYGGFAEVPGPARLLTRDEYEAVIASLGG
jgi:hypothetical protein